MCITSQTLTWWSSLSKLWSKHLQTWSATPDMSVSMCFYLLTSKDPHTWLEYTWTIDSTHVFMSRGEFEMWISPKTRDAEPPRSFHRCHSPVLHERSAEAQGMLGDAEMMREREPTLERTRSAGEVHTQAFNRGQVTLTFS